MRVLPKPAKIDVYDGVFIFSKNTKIVGASKLVEDELHFLDFNDGKDNFVEFMLGSCKGSYSVVTTPDKIVVIANDQEGLFYGAMTLKQLILDYYDDGFSNIPCFGLLDKPSCSHRGYMLDISRHFFKIDTLKKIADVMSYCKMNVFHLHLSDNQGYRLQSNAFPKLNEIGSKRAQTRGDGKPVEGFYTFEEMKDFVTYCSERFITVIPEIDLPGHTLDILASYPEFGCKEENYQVAERFKIDDRVLCVGKKQVYEFCNKLLDEICEVFPSKFIHIGGDEVPKTRWKNCPDCQEMLKKLNLSNEEQLQGYFTNAICQHLISKCRQGIVWNDALKSNNLDNSAVIQYWYDSDKGNKAAKAAENGHKLIVSTNFAYYFDYCHGINSLKKAYNYKPLSLVKNKSAENNVIGIEAPLWTEWVETEEQLFKQTFPRLFAVAEKSWNLASDSYKDFEQRLYNILDMMMAYGYDFTEVKKSNPLPLTSMAQAVEFTSRWLKP